MTYCVGMVLDRGLVLMSDTRTNSGVDNISVFRKMFHWSVPGERIVTLMTAGNLATTQAVISRLEERTKAPEERGTFAARAADDVPGRRSRPARPLREIVLETQEENGEQGRAASPPR